MTIPRVRERDVELVVSELEAEQNKLYRGDGSRFFGDEEHAERLGKLREEATEKLSRIVSKAEEDAVEYEREALACAYTDPTKDLTSTERARLDSSRPLVAEDCERLSVEELADRIRAVSAGPDKVAKVLHARYGASRVRQIDERLEQESRAGRRTPGSSVEIERLSALRAAVRELEEQLKDPKMEERRKAAEEAAKQSRRLVREARSRQFDVDGTAERAAQQHAEKVRSLL